MKVIKYIFFFILIIIVLGAVYLATLDGTYDVKRSRVIKAEPEVVFDEINDYRNWKSWGPWYEMDSTIQETYPEKTSGEGASYSWTSSEGEGSMRTLKVDAPKSIDQEITFKTPFGDMKSEIYWRLERVKEGTKVTWGMRGEMPFMSRWMAKGMEDQMGPMEERGLELMDEVIQKKINVYSIETNGVVEYSGGYYLYATTTCKIGEISDKYPTLLLKVYSFIKKNNVRTSGGPFTLYHKYDEDNDAAMFSVCYPIPEKMITTADSGILTGFMKNGTYFKTTLKGSYRHSDEAWKKAIEGAQSLEGYTEVENGEPFEVYVNNPHETPNPADLITEIYIPVHKIPQVARVIPKTEAQLDTVQ